MKVKGILLDIDNTLYDYDKTHMMSLKIVFDFFGSKFKLSSEVIIESYNKARANIHIELKGTASSHNRLLYFQRMCEILNINPLNTAFKVYNLYWDSFLINMEKFDYVDQLLEKYKNKICLITDLTAHIQYRKIAALGLDGYINKIVTSEEAGREKPHPYMFMSAVKKLNLNHDEICMIGDSFKKDIIGATNLGIKSYWLNRSLDVNISSNDLIQKCNTFKDIWEDL